MLSGLHHEVVRAVHNRRLFSSILGDCGDGEMPRMEMSIAPVGKVGFQWSALQ